MNENQLFNTGDYVERRSTSFQLKRVGRVLKDTSLRNIDSSIKTDFCFVVWIDANEAVLIPTVHLKRSSIFDIFLAKIKRDLRE